MANSVLLFVVMHLNLLVAAAGFVSLVAGLVLLRGGAVALIVAGILLLLAGTVPYMRLRTRKG